MPPYTTLQGHLAKALESSTFEFVTLQECCHLARTCPVTRGAIERSFELLIQRGYYQRRYTSQGELERRGIFALTRIVSSTWSVGATIKFVNECAEAFGKDHEKWIVKANAREAEYYAELQEQHAAGIHPGPQTDWLDHESLKVRPADV